MPDGSRSPALALPPALVSRAAGALGAPDFHPATVALVNWMLFLQEDRRADPVEVARHYAFWSHSKRYQDAVSRMRF
jgi:hypothetical protein